MKAERGEEYGVRRFVVGDVPAATPKTLQDFLHSGGILEARFLVELGAVYVNEKRITDPAYALNQNDSLRVHSQPRRFSKPPDLRKRIVEETASYLIVDKPPGLPVHSLVDNLRENLISFLEEELHHELYVTHRLDVETSGCLLIAKNLSVRSSLNRLFRERLITKHYVAVTETDLDPRTYIHFMKPTHAAPKEISDIEHDGWLKCELRILECIETDGVFENRIELVTGRPQQIRAQLAFLGAPIIGDKKYGSRVELETANKISLKCESLTFDRDLLQSSQTQEFSDEGD